ncbi:MAG: hypothetical protein IT425_10615 [Pirellulales bacterium]|nr:hypothetical protein [Pirellulales bacterium]
MSIPAKHEGLALAPQRSLDFSDAGRFREHLLQCGYSKHQAGLAGLVFEKGVKREIGEDVVTVLEISSRDAARLLGCSNRCVTKCADQLARGERSAGVPWFRIIPQGAAKPPLYVLDHVAARSLSRLDQLDTLLVRSDERGPPADRGGDSGVYSVCTRCEPGVNRCVPVCTSSGVLHEKTRFKTGVSTTTSTTSTSSSQQVHTGTQQVHTSTHGYTAVGSGTRRAAREIARPWDRAEGVTDDELVAAVRRGDTRLLRSMYDVAVDRDWLGDDSDDQWLRFLTAAHHCATAKLKFGRIGRLIAFNTSGLDVSRCSQRSDQWAGEMLAREHRDPALARRMMEGGDEP